MERNDIFESSVRSHGDLAGVFECDGEEGYFFLFDLTKGTGEQGAGVICVHPENADLKEADVAIKWSKSEEIVGLYIRGGLCAAFDQKGRKFGGNYGTREAPSIPARVVEQFR
jgi:hypothetical protein